MANKQKCKYEEGAADSGREFKDWKKKTKKDVFHRRRLQEQSEIEWDVRKSWLGKDNATLWEMYAMVEEIVDRWMLPGQMGTDKVIVKL